MSYRKENKQFLDILDLVKQTLKGTRFLLDVDANEPVDPEDDDDPIWKEYYEEIGVNPEIGYAEHRVEHHGHSQTISILDPTVQAPYVINDHNKIYHSGLVTLCENYEDFDEYFVHRSVCYMYDEINLDSSTDADADDDSETISIQKLKKYIKKNLLSDLETLSAACLKLKELRESVQVSTL